MKKINNILLLLSGTLLFFLTILGILFYKSFPSFVQQNIYYCQAFAQTISIQLFTEQITNLLLGFIFSSFIFVLVKLLFVYYKIRKFREHIVHLHTLPLLYKQTLLKHFLPSQLILIDTETPHAFCFGYKNPKIYISTELLHLMNIQEFEAILIHEKYHLQHNHSLFLTLFSFVQSFLPFFPFVRDIINNYRLRCEIQADHAAISFAHNEQPLISALKKMLMFSSFSSIAVAAFSEEALDKRIRSILSNERHTMRIQLKNIVVTFLSCIVLTGIIVSPSKAVEIETQGSPASLICLTGTRCSVWCSASASVVPPQSIHASYPYSPSQQSH